MATSVAQPNPGALDTRRDTVHASVQSLAPYQDRPDASRSKIVTSGQVWDNGHILPEELELTDEEREQWRSVPTSTPIHRN